MCAANFNVCERRKKWMARCGSSSILWSRLLPVNGKRVCAEMASAFCGEIGFCLLRDIFMAVGLIYAVETEAAFKTNVFENNNDQ